jgi:hypothetical protein
MYLVDGCTKVDKSMYLFLFTYQYLRLMKKQKKLQLLIPKIPRLWFRKEHSKNYPHSLGYR